MTDEFGNAYFSFKIIKGLDNSVVSLICEGNGVKTPLSIPIKIINDAGEIRYDTDFSGTYSVEFAQNSEGN